MSAAVVDGLWPAGLRDLVMPVRRIRRLCDLDATPYAVASRLGADPLFGPLVAERPGPRSLDAADAGHGGRRERAVWTVPGARRSGPPRWCEVRHPRDAADGGPIRLFSEPGGELTGLGGRGAGPRAVIALADGAVLLGAGTDRGAAARAPAALPGRPARRPPASGARAGSTRMRGGAQGRDQEPDGHGFRAD
ncbi:hypothetical protein O1L68_07665 [Streptomyces lydicus]|nr:hypothetical protein [Streptomyces lydicus]